MPLGMEVAGVVAATGSGAQGYTGALTVGDDVIATIVGGGYSERVLADGVRRRAQASGRCRSKRRPVFCLVGGTAWHLLANTKVGMNDTVLIHGASGGVGLMAVQLAVARGARVIATASPARHDQLRAYGAEPVEYGAGLTDRVRAIGSVDAALDLVGTDEALDTSVALVADRTRIATIAGSRGPPSSASRRSAAPTAGRPSATRRGRKSWHWRPPASWR